MLGQAHVPHSIMFDLEKHLTLEPRTSPRRKSLSVEGV